MTNPIKIGQLKQIWRYPVKGMVGESVNSIEISSAGLLGDRVLAVRDVNRNEIQSCKFRPDLLKCSAFFKDDHLGSHHKKNTQKDSNFISRWASARH